MYYNLDKKNYEQIERLVQITNSISTIYDNLYNLEAIGYKDTDLYKRNVEYLSIARETENKYYRELNWTTKKCQSISLYLLENQLNDNATDDMELILSQEVDNKIYRRIIHNINEIYSNSSVVELSTFEKWVLKNYMEDPERELAKSDRDRKTLEKSFEQELNNYFLMGLENLIQENDRFKEKFIKVKYDTIFLNKDIESEMVLNNFNVFMIVSSSGHVKNLLGIKNYDFNEMQDYYVEKSMWFQIVKLLEITNEEYNIDKNLFQAILRIAYLKANVLLCDEDFLEELKDLIYTRIFNRRYDLKRPQSTKVICQILSKDKLSKYNI